MLNGTGHVDAIDQLSTGEPITLNFQALGACNNDSRAHNYEGVVVSDQAS